MYNIKYCIIHSFYFFFLKTIKSVVKLDLKSQIDVFQPIIGITKKKN